MWDAASGRELYDLYGYWSKREHTHHGAVSAVCFSPDSQRILTAGSAGVIIWPVTERPEAQIVLKMSPTRTVHSAIFSPDGSHIVVGYADGLICVWDARTGKRVWSRYVHVADLSHSSFVNVESVVYSPDGKCIASGGSEGTVKMCDALSGEELLSLNPRRGYISSVAFAPDGKKFIAACFEHVALMWDVRGGEPLQTFETENPVVAVAISPDGGQVATGLTNGLVVWDVDSKKRIVEIPAGSVTDLAFSPDGNRLAVASRRSPLSIWDVSLS